MRQVKRRKTKTLKQLDVMYATVSPYERAKAAGLTSIKRWEEGREHHPKSLEIVRFMATHDAKDCEDSLDIKLGGDGDNGEAMAFLLDAYFELIDFERIERSNALYASWREELLR